MCCRLCSQSPSEISVREKGVNSADVTATGEHRTGVVNSEPTWCSMRRSEGRSDSHGPSKLTQYSVAYGVWGVFEGQSAEVNIVKKTGGSR